MISEASSKGWEGSLKLTLQYQIHILLGQRQIGRDNSVWRSWRLSEKVHMKLSQSFLQATCRAQIAGGTYIFDTISSWPT